MTGQVRLTFAAAVATALASLSLTPVLESGPWAGPVAAAILVVALTAGAMRHLHAPRWSVVAVPAASLVLLLTVLFAHAAAPLGFVPGPAAWRSLEATFRAGIDVVWAQAPPVAATRGVALIMASAVGVVALAVDALAVTFRHAAVAGLPLLALYLVPAAVVDGGAPWLLFVITAAGWLMLLVADSRDSLRRWGRTLSVRQSPGGSSPVDVALGSSSRRIGAAALVTAVAIPLAVPILSDGVFGRGNGGDSAPNSAADVGQTGGLDPVAALRRDLTQENNGLVFTYRTNDDSPSYFRLATLTSFADSKWTLGQPIPQLVPPGQTTFSLTDSVVSGPASESATAVTTNIQVSSAYSDKRLPLPLTATFVRNAGDGWVYDQATSDVFGTDPSRTTAGLHYTVDSLDVSPTRHQLRTATGLGGNAHGATPDTGLLVVPDQTRAELQPYLDALGQQPTTYDQAMAIQDWLRTSFQYSLGPASNPSSADDLSQFLTDRRGYCQQFAAVMALMARMDGIPSRVAIGFTPGASVGSGPTRVWNVTWHDAHAWPELWFPTVGWVRFEPTPSGQGGTGAGLPTWANPKITSSPHSGAHNHHPFKPLHGAIDPGADRGRFSAGGGVNTATTSPVPFNWTPWVLAATAVALVLLVVPALTRRRVRARRRRQTDPRLAVEAAWAEVLDTATDVDLEPRDVESPRDLAHRLGREGGINSTAMPAMRRLARAVEQARYARDPGRVDDPWGDATIVCDALMNYAGARRARMARWWPTSAREHLRRQWRAATDRVDLVQDRATARARRRPSASGA